MRLFWIFLLFGSTKIFAQNTIEVEVPNVPSSEGKISVALYDTDDSFLKFDGVFASSSSEAIQGTTKVFLEDIPEGTYAIALFHDKNDNGQLDTNWMGIPKEKVAFSNAKMKLFGPPSYSECSFNLSQDETVVIRF